MEAITCPKCGKKFSYKLHLEIHLKTCNGVGFRCPLCSNIFPSILMLKSHIYKSHGHLWHRCPICGVEYKSIVVHYYYKWLRTGDPSHALLWMLTKGRSQVEGENKKLIFATALKTLEKIGDGKQ